MKSKKNDQKNPEPAKTHGKTITGQQGTVAAGAPVDKASLKKAEQAVDFEWSPGDVILDLYEVRKVTERYGDDSVEKDYHEGGFGRVYKVWHRSWQRDMAVKTPRAEVFTTADQKEAFTRECETWINMGLHPHIATCHYVRELGGVPRVFSEYAEGGTLEDWIRYGRLYEGDARKALARILDVSIQFARGLHYSHERGIIHQDVKPLNALMWNDQTLKVTDFGLAGARQKAGVAGTCNSPGDGDGQSIRVSVGGMTPSHCSPEQAAGKKLTRRTDIWSWAVSVLQMFNGEVTWQSGSLAAMAMESYLEGDGENEEIPSMPSGMADLLRRCFREDPDDRPHDLRECVAELCRIYRSELGGPYPRPEPRAAGDTADALNNRALSLLDLGHPHEAERLWIQALKENPQHLEATINYRYYQWGKALITDEDYLSYIKEIRDAHKKNPIYWYTIGIIQKERGDTSSANSAFKTSLELGYESLDLMKQESSEICLKKLLTNLESITALSFSYDGSRVIIGTFWGEIILYDIEQGIPLKAFKSHDLYNVHSVTVSNSGKYVLAGGKPNSVILLDLSTETLTTLGHHEHFVLSVSISPNGLYGLSGGAAKGTVKLWELETGACLDTFREFSSPVDFVGFTPDGRYFIASSNNSIKLYDINTLNHVRSFEDVKYSVRSISFSPDGSLFVGINNNKLKLWELDTGKCIRSFEIKTSYNSSVAFTCKGECLIFNNGYQISLLDTKNGRYLRTWDGQPKRKKGSYFDILAVSKDGRYSLSGNHLWEINKPELFFSFLICRPSTFPEVSKVQEKVKELISFAKICIKNREWVNAYDTLREAQMYEGYEHSAEILFHLREIAEQGERTGLKNLWTHKNFEIQKNIRLSLLTHDGRSCVLGSDELKLLELENGTYRWDAKACTGSFVIKTHLPIPMPGPHIPNHIISLCLSDDSRYILTGGSDNIVRLWDTENGTCLHIFKGHEDHVWSVSLSRDSKYAVSGDRKGVLRIWDIEAGTTRWIAIHAARQSDHDVMGDRLPVSTVGFSPDSRHFISGGMDGKLKLWEFETGKQLHVFEGHSRRINCVSFIGDSYFLSGSDDATILLWDIERRRCVKIIEGHKGGIETFVITGDSKYVISGGTDKTIRVWEIERQYCIKTLEEQSVIRNISLSSDCRFLLSLTGYDNENKNLRVWELDWKWEFPEPPC